MTSGADALDAALAPDTVAGLGYGRKLMAKVVR